MARPAWLALCLALACLAAPGVAHGQTTWLCRPGLAANPCTTSLATSVVRADGTSTIRRFRRPARPPVDCFYVYPTVSLQPTVNANLDIDPAERGVATLQASRFSQACRVFAPMYRQITLAGIAQPGGINAQSAAIAYSGVTSAFHDYLAHDNHGRGVVLVGHSQGASLLIALLRNEVDPNPALRRRLVSAIVLGGAVLVPVGRPVGGTFQHIPACRAPRQTGCVVGYSSFDTVPPPNSLFGRVGGGLNPFSPVPQGVPVHVLCINPAAPAGGRAPLAPFLRAPAGAPAPWVSYPREYTGRCRSGDGATWLQVSHIPDRRDTRPVVQQVQGPRWGLHVYDVNIALGNLVGLVRDQAAAFTRPARSAAASRRR